MGRAPCCDKANVKKGPWSPEEDMTLKNYVERHGTGGNWIALPHKAGLRRCGKSCRLRWLNYLRPDIKHGGFTEEEDNIICTLYNKIGSRWSVIASQLPGRTDNDIKNYWNTKLKKKLLEGKINSLKSNNNNKTTNIQFPAASTNAIAETHDYGISACFDTNPSTALPYDPAMQLSNYQQKFDPQILSSDPTDHQFPLPRLMEVSGFGTSKNYHCLSSSSSSSLEVSSLSASSSVVLKNNHYYSYSQDGSGGGIEDELLMEFGFDQSPYDMLTSFGFQE